LIGDLERALAIVEQFLRDGIEDERPPIVQPRAGTGTAITEAPRGLLIHSYTFDAEGRITSADVITPTALNRSQHGIAFSPGGGAIRSTRRCHASEALGNDCARLRSMHFVFRAPGAQAMKPVLVIGLGNPSMGDDGVGCSVAERPAPNPRLPESVEVICGGTDLLRYAGQMAGRERVVVIDAIQGDAVPGNLVLLDETDPRLDTRQPHAHHLSAVQAIRLLKLTTPTRFLLLGVSVCSAGMDSGLFPSLVTRMPAILDRALYDYELGFHSLGNSRPL